MAENARVGSIQDRIAALNVDQLGHPPVYDHAIAAKKARPPPPPTRPAAEFRTQSTNNPPLQSHAPSSTQPPGNRPTGPYAARNGSAGARRAVLPPPVPMTGTKSNADEGKGEQKPALPPRLPSRRPSEPQASRRASVESTSSAVSARSNVSTATSLSTNDGQSSRVRAPVYDPSTLPALPPKRPKDEPVQQPALPARRSFSTANGNGDRKRDEPSPSPAPTLPSRPSLPVRPRAAHAQTEPPKQPPRRSALDFALNRGTEAAPSIPARPSRVLSTDTADSNSTPPPVPLASRPDLSAIQASKPTSTTNTSSSGSCLKCRDFSAPDAHAARFPREAIPRTDIAWLASQLTSPFPSATDQARAIFTWLHHNVAYDVDSYFRTRDYARTKSTPQGTIASGLAVCEGYAGLFAALAVAAGLEAVVVSGHGKGYGHSQIGPGDPTPPVAATGHAWNAVRIDDGRWHLVDPCWGAGNVQGPDAPYEKNFKPEHFTAENDDFGRRHFPADERYFFRDDGRPSISWDEYMREGAVPGPRVFSGDGGAANNGISERGFLPAAKQIPSVATVGAEDVVRFQFETICPHWDLHRHGQGPPRLFLLQLPGSGNQKKLDKVPFETDGRRVWWCDVPRARLGIPGGNVKVLCVTQFDGRDARGLTAEGYRQKAGRVGMSWGGLAEWEVV